MRNLRCPACSELLTSAQHKALRSWTSEVECSRCGMSRMNIYDVDVDIQKGCEKYLDDDVVRKVKWHHTTNAYDWLDQVQNAWEKPIVHVGTFQAAMARSRDIKGNTVRTSRYRHVVRISEDATIDPVVQEDQDYWMNSWEEYKFDVTRYVNRFESPGSISLLVNPNFLEFVETHGL